MFTEDVYDGDICVGINVYDEGGIWQGFYPLSPTSSKEGEENENE